MVVIVVLGIVTKANIRLEETGRLVMGVGHMGTHGTVGTGGKVLFKPQFNSHFSTHNRQMTLLS